MKKNAKQGRASKPIVLALAVASGAFILVALTAQSIRFYDQRDRELETTIAIPPPPRDAERAIPIKLVDGSSNTVNLTIDTAAFMAMDEVVFNDPHTNTVLLFKRNDTRQNSNSNTIVGSVEVNGIPQPMTITISTAEVFASIPLTSGYYSGSGPAANVKIVKNKPVSDRILKEPPSRQSPITEFPKEITRKCLNCD